MIRARMDPIDLARELVAIPRRAPGSDAERRAALRLRDRLAGQGRTPTVETLWVRPGVAAAAAWAAGLGLVGSVVAAAEPRVGLAVLAATLFAYLPELTGLRARPLRRLTRERATQNVVAAPRDPPATEANPGHRALTLVIAAGCDAPPRHRGLARPLGALARPLWPSARAWLGLALLALVITAGLRALGETGRGVGAVQLVPTVALLLAAVGLVEVTLSPAGDGAGEAGGAAVALALAAALDGAPPRHLAVEVVVAGAASADAVGMERWVRRRRRTVRAEEIAVLGFGACGAGDPAWRTGDGPALRLRAHPRLLALCGGVAERDPALRARAAAGRGGGLALPPRRAGWPSLGVETTGAEAPEDGDALDPEALRRTLDFALALVAALDEELADAPARATPGDGPADAPAGRRRGRVRATRASPPGPAHPGR